MFMCTGGMNDVDAYSSMTAEFSSMNNPLESWIVGDQAEVAALNQPFSPSCVYCKGDHLFDYCPHNPDSICFVGNNYMNDLDAYNSGWRLHHNSMWEDQDGVAEQYACIEPPTFDFQEQVEPQWWTPQQPFEQQQQQDSSSMEALLWEFMANNDAIMQSQAASLRNLEIQVEQLTQELKYRTQEARQMENAHREEKEQPDATSYAPICPDAWLLDENAEEHQATAWPFDQAPAWVHISAPATPVAPAIACTISPLAPEDDHAPTWSVSSITSTPETLAKQEEPSPTGAEGVAEPTMVTPQLANRSIARPISKIGDVLEKVDKNALHVDFVIPDYEEDIKVPINLGKQFLTTKQTLMKINVMDALQDPSNTKDYAPVKTLLTPQESDTIGQELENKGQQHEATTLKRRILKKRAHSFLSPVD